MGAVSKIHAMEENIDKGKLQVTIRSGTDNHFPTKRSKDRRSGETDHTNRAGRTRCSGNRNYDHFKEKA